MGKHFQKRDRRALRRWIFFGAAIGWASMKPMARIVVPEILDSLPAGDPGAARSRRDLILVDAYMGNTRWILGKIRSLEGIEGPLVEIGAGDGRLCSRLHSGFPKRRVVGFDLSERPPRLEPGVDWVRGDFFNTLRTVCGGVCAGSLILHHFQAGALEEIGRRLREFRALVFCEPLRSRISLGFSAIASPLAGEVTRHDMPASIRAGFLPGDLARYLGLDRAVWSVTEKTTWRGGLRFCALRRE